LATLIFKDSKGSGMGWRADKAYEEAQRDGFRRWRKSLTWGEYLGWELKRHGPFLAGAAASAVVLWLVLR
jgi:hypothetical protein